jgi:type IV secretory pathway VirB9-like protein
MAKRKPKTPLADLIPTNWLDPLLTGPDAVIQGYSFTPKDIERLLLAIKERVRKAESKQRGDIGEGS